MLEISVQAYLKHRADSCKYGYDLFKNYPIYSEVGTYEEVFADYLNTNGTAGSEVSGRITVTVPEQAAEPSPVEPAPVE
ncbi:MAG: hypothetical protein WBJ13_08060, partial [Sedimentibacter sp.]